jgi:hypothetical protein
VVELDEQSLCRIELFVMEEEKRMMMAFYMDAAKKKKQTMTEKKKSPDSNTVKGSTVSLTSPPETDQK